MESSTATIVICQGCDISLTSTAYDIRWIILSTICTSISISISIYPTLYDGLSLVQYTHPFPFQFTYLTLQDYYAVYHPIHSVNYCPELLMLSITVQNYLCCLTFNAWGFQLGSSRLIPLRFRNPSWSAFWNFSCSDWLLIGARDTTDRPADALGGWLLSQSWLWFLADALGWLLSQSWLWILTIHMVAIRIKRMLRKMRTDGITSTDALLVLASLGLGYDQPCNCNIFLITDALPSSPIYEWWVSSHRFHSQWDVHS